MPSEFMAYENYGHVPLWKQIMKTWGWVGEEKAKRIAEEAAYQQVKWIAQQVKEQHGRK